MTRAPRLVLLALVLLPASLSAQVSGRLRATSFYETYRFDPGLIFNKVTELTVPVGLEFRFGGRTKLALSTGFANVKLVSADATQLSDQVVSGPLDTETRLSYDVLPGRLVVLATGVVPTGTKTVAQEELAVLGAISSDVIGFSAPSLGSGGNVGGGFVGAVPLGKFALGFGATYKQALSYQPVSSQPNQLQPGSELRVRGGLEGSLTSRTYLRLAGIYARSARDKVGGVVRNGVGSRLIGYLSVNHGLGAATVTVYGFDVYRGGPQVEQTAAGAAYLPKGNLIAAGARVDWGITPRTTLSPRFEVRTSSAAPDTSGVALERLGSSLRVGMDLRQTVSPRLTAVVLLGGVTGNVVQAGTSIGFTGMRAALTLELSR